MTCRSRFFGVACVVGVFSFFADAARRQVKESFASLGDISVAFLGLVIVYACNNVCQLVASSARYNAHVLNPDQYVYQSAKANAGGAKDAILLINDDSPAGKFNRAQRAVNNMGETQHFVLATFLAAVLVVPNTAIRALGVYAVGRVLFSVGYLLSTQGRLFGLMLSNMLGAGLLLGVVTLLALQHCGVLKQLPAIFVPNAFQ